jgi:anti-sigma B factor antagonist
VNRDYLIVRRGDAVHVLLAGDLDMVAAPAVTRAIDRALAVQTERIVVNLDAVTFLDSSGIHAIVNGYQDAVRVGTGFAVGPAAPDVARVLALTGLHHGLAAEPAVEN